VLIVPGYGMNSYIFSYHPRGPSLEGYLAAAGFEVWRVDLRAQGRSVSIGGDQTYGLEDLAVHDLGAVIDGALARTRTRADRADVIGASLGGTVVFMHAVLKPAHRIGAMVAIGTPVRWVEIHPLVRAAFHSPTLAGLVQLKGSRKLASLALRHVVGRAPWVLSIYMNPSIVDTRAAQEMAKTVEDPSRHVNRQIAHWIRGRDLVVHGTNISESLASIRTPLLCVCANKDGIVPRATAEFPFRRVSSPSKQLLEVGTHELAMAHADMFVSNEAHARVFMPVSTWLAEQNREGSRT
jgi:pimeloyl-ACP methyl ester carboxylesterase